MTLCPRDETEYLLAVVQSAEADVGLSETQARPSFASCPSPTYRRYARADSDVAARSPSGPIYRGEVTLKIASAEAGTLELFVAPPPQTTWHPGQATLATRISNLLRGKR